MIELAKIRQALMLLAYSFAVSLGCSQANASSLDGLEGQHGFAMHGAPAHGPAFTHLKYANPSAPKGGTIHLHSIGSYDSFNSFIVKGSTAAGLGLLYNTLTTSSLDEAFTQYGELAEEVFMPEDRSWVAFKLRADARWHDGKPVTPDDVLWSFETLLGKGLPFFRYYYGNVAEAVKVGDDTVRFNFKPGENQELPLILGQLTILPKHYWADREFDKTTLEPPLGSGPYRIKDFEAGRSVTFERNADYWGKDIPVHKGFFNFDLIRYDYYRDTDIALEAFKAGEYDYRPESSSKSWATAYDVPALKDGTLIKKGFDHSRSAGMQGFAFNTRRPGLSDSRVRQALAYAFDFEWSNENLFYSQYTRTRSYFDNSELAATGLPGADELKLLTPLRGKIPDEVFTAAYEAPAGGGPRALRKNLREAGKILDAAGWPIRNGKRQNTEGVELTFEVLLVSPSFERIVLPFTQNLKKLGIYATVRTVDTSQYLRRRDTYDFDVIIHTFAQSMSPGNEQRSFFGSESAANEGGRNVVGIRSPAIDQLIEHVIAAPDRQQLITATRALDRVLQWGHWMIPQWHIAYDRLAHWDKFGMPPIIPSRGVQFASWWVDTSKARRLATTLKSEQRR
jgi:microcin C transport system substrate-binding protein